MRQTATKKTEPQGSPTEASQAKTAEVESTPELNRTYAERTIKSGMRALEYHTTSQGHDRASMSLMHRTLKDLQTRLAGCDSDQARIAELDALVKAEHTLAHRSADAFGKVTPRGQRWNFHETDCTAERGWHERHVTQDRIELILVGGPKNAHHAIAQLAETLGDAMRYDPGVAAQGLSGAIEALERVIPPAAKLPRQ